MKGFLIGMYLSDILCAVRRVDRNILCAYIRQHGISHSMSKFMCIYLAPRNANVAVQGCEFDSFVIDDEVFQGTVFGPLL